MNTRDKRASAILVALAFRALLPLPDASLNQGDRQQVGFLYRGILASAAVGGPNVCDPTQVTVDASATSAVIDASATTAEMTCP